MFVRSTWDDIPTTWQAFGREQTMIMLFFTARKLTVFDLLLKGSKFNQLYVVDYKFPDLEKSNMNFTRRKWGLTFRVNTDNWICHQRSKIVSKFDKHHLSRIPLPSYSPPLDLCDFWFFGQAQMAFKNRNLLTQMISPGFDPSASQSQSQSHFSSATTPLPQIYYEIRMIHRKQWRVF
jgi:hypothetical protein